MANVADSFDNWLERELAGQLCPVAAPDSLWRRIHEQRRPLRVGPQRWWNRTTGPVAATLLLTLLAAVVWRMGAIRDPQADLRMLAERELRGLEDGSGKIDIRSTDPREIRAWVRARSGIEVQLPDSATSGNQEVRLVGAGLVQLDRHSVAVISYRVGGKPAALVVAGGRAGSARSPAGNSTGTPAGNDSPLHGAPRIGSAKEMSLYSWSVGAAEYTIAFGGTEEPQRACLLCHANPPALVVFR
jgi:hypothetical protein